LGLSLVGIYPLNYIWYGFIGSAIIIWQHRDNIQRLLNGTERRLGVPAARIN
jgi:glycerol-3-phosphate acyltransferase PlsY